MLKKLKIIFNHKLQLFFLLSFLSLFPQISFAAPTDCIQTSSDGERNCTQPAQQWNGSLGTKGQYWEDVMTASFNNLVLRNSPNSVTIKYNNTPPTALPCTSFGLCNEVTGIVPNNSEGYVYVWVLPVSDPTHYIVDGEEIYNQYTCSVQDNFVYTTPGVYYGLCKPPAQPKNLGCTTCQNNSSGVLVVPHPINTGSGNQYEVETDYVYNSSTPIAFTRYYNSKMIRWSHNYQRTLIYTSTSYGDYVALNRPTQDSLAFKLVSGVWTAATPDILGTLSSTGSGSALVWTYVNENNEIETYNSAGILINITQTNGNVLTLTYDSLAQLSGITDSNTNHLTINTSISVSSCAGIPLMTSVVGVGGLDTYSYNYDSNCNITKITYPDSNYKSYTYNPDGLLLYVTDENGDDYM